MAPCALWAWACLWAVGRGRGGAGCHCHGHCQQPRATASTMVTPSRQGATWGWWRGGTESPRSEGLALQGRVGVKCLLGLPQASNSKRQAAAGAKQGRC